VLEISVYGTLSHLISVIWYHELKFQLQMSRKQQYSFPRNITITALVLCVCSTSTVYNMYCILITRCLMNQMSYKKIIYTSWFCLQEMIYSYEAQFSLPAKTKQLVLWCNISLAIQKIMCLSYFTNRGY
jgi:hypothetical protein